MITDDFLADLEAQLREAKPRRDVRPALAVAALLALVLLALAFVPRGGEPPAPAARSGVRVQIVNATQALGTAQRVADRLQRAGYSVLPVTNAPAQNAGFTRVQAADPAARNAAERLRRLLGALPEDGGWTKYAPVRTTAQVVITLGQDQLAPDPAAAQADALARALRPRRAACRPDPEMRDFFLCTVDGRRFSFALHDSGCYDGKPLGRAPTREIDGCANALDGARVRIVDGSGSRTYGAFVSDELTRAGAAVVDLRVGARRERTRVVTHDAATGRRVAASIGAPPPQPGDCCDPGENVVLELGRDGALARALETQTDPPATNCRPDPERPKVKCEVQGRPVLFTVKPNGCVHGAWMDGQRSEPYSGCGLKP